MFNHWFKNLGKNLHMHESKENPYQIGTYLVGNKNEIDGWAWFYQHDDSIAIAKCELTLKKDIKLNLDEPIHYLGLRLDYSKRGCNEIT